MNSEPNDQRRWGDDAQRDEATGGTPKWLRIAGAIVVAFLGVGAIGVFLLQRFGAPTNQRIDPLGLIVATNPAKDGAQRTFDSPPVVKGKFVGVETCRECHADKVASYKSTPHFKTSQTANEETILGVARAAKSHPTTHPALRYEIEEKKGRFWQTAIVVHESQQHRFSKPFDIVIGSGLHAQTFLFWEKHRLYQLPLTFSAELDSWTKSPGYPEGMANYSREASSGCMRCHVTYMEELEDAWNSYRPEATMLGISCENCHGRGSAHVAYRKSKSTNKSLAHDPIVQPATLSRERQLDLCAQCHAGVGKFHQPPFTYQPGQPLDEFIAQKDLDVQSFGVHTTNQLARLRLSKCFQTQGPDNEQGARAMTCTTCHDPHLSEHNNLPRASSKCLGCHNAADCGKHARWGAKIETNCIDCHMPSAVDRDTDLATRDEITFPRMRDHYIAKYPQLSDAVELAWQSDSKESNATPSAP